MSMLMLKLRDERIESLVSKIIDSDGVIEPDDEALLKALLAEKADLIVDAACAVKDLKARVATSKLWRDDQMRREKGWKAFDGRLRAMMTEAMLEYAKLTGERTLRATAATVTLVESPKGEVVVADLDAVPDFYKRTKFVVEVDAELAGEDLRAGKKIPGLELHKEPHVQIR